MPTLTRSTRAVLAAIALIALIVVVTLPALAADPSGSPAASAAPSAGAEASKAPKPSKEPKPGKADRVPGVEVTVTGTVAQRTAADGETEYTVTSGSRVLTLDAGPSWFLKGEHSLADLVGKRVTIVGEQRPGETEIDVRTVDGTLLREPGRPAWAGGWKAVGEDHPGWSQEKWDRWQARKAERAERFGACFPPGQCPDKPGKGNASSPAP